MNVVIISKEKYEEMVNKLNRLSDRVNEKGKKGSSTAGWTIRKSASSCASVPVPCRRFATTVRWLTPR